MSKATIGFYGGVGSVTGANFLFESDGVNILIDAGLVQSSSFAPKENTDPFPYDVAGIDYLFVTHAHADHIGRIPKLVREGFRGTIYSTPPTKDIAAVMLQDALHIMTEEYARKDLPPLFTAQDIEQSLALWKTVGYHEQVVVSDSIKAIFTNAGHILGSAMVSFIKDGKKVVFTGDVGNAPQPLVEDPEEITDADYMVIESVYGDRVHEDSGDRTEILLSHIKDTIERKGTLIIPAFSLERTQIILYEINNFVEQKLIAPIPTFLDSPLAIAVTDIYRSHRGYLNKEVREQIERGDDIFNFPKLSFTRTVAQSREIAEVSGPKIIIAGSGMSHAGRVLSHERRYLEDPHTTLLLVGYQSVGSIGRLLQDGARKITIEREEVTVRARVESIRGYSGHADRDALLSFVEGSAEHLKDVFVTMGEERSALFLVQRIRDYLGVRAVAPSLGEKKEIEF